MRPVCECRASHVTPADSYLKYGCCNASAAVILSSGSYVNILASKSIQADVTCGNFCLSCGAWLGGRAIVFASGREVYSGQLCGVGGPSNLKIMEMSSISPFAWNNGSLSNSSAKMQPTDQMSMAVE